MVRVLLCQARRVMIVAAFAAAGVVAGCAADDESPPSGAGLEPAEPAEPCPASAPDAQAAESMAKACGRRIEVESQRSEYSEVYVDPSGLHTMVASLVPQRGRRLDGTWGAIDTTLQRVDGGIAPTATAAHVRFSSGGSGPFVTLTREGHTFTLSWPTPLPAPTLAGDSATYADVLPDVDLVVKATDAGFTHLLVIKTARAAAHPAVRRARYRLGGDATLRATPDGGLIAEAQGVQVAAAEAPVMWDGAQHSRARASDTGADTTSGKLARVGSAISSGHLVLTPDAAMLNDPGAAYPLVVDPLWVVGQAQWAYATADNQNGPTTDGTIAAGDPSPAAACLRVGNDPDSSHQYRSFMRFPITGIAGSQILTAKISGKVDHTWKCGANRPTYFYRTAAISATPRQGWPGPALQLLLGNNNVHANESSCNEPNMPFEVTSGTLVNDVQASANAHAASYFVGISAGENTGGLNESNTERWMRYFLADFKLNITFNRKPDKPGSLTVDGKACVAGANRPFVKTTTPTLRAHVTDPDGDSMQVWFAWGKWNGSVFIDEPGGGAQNSVPNGGTALFTATGNVDGGIYAFRAQSNDSPSHSPSLASDVTASPGNCEWQVDLSPPTAPGVSSDVYLEGPTGCPGGACGGVGQTGHFTFSSSPDTQSFLWGLSDPPTNAVSPAVLGGSVTIDWAPTSSGPVTLFVRAIDRAGNESNKVYQFVVAGDSTALARWLLNDPVGTTQLGDDTGHGNTGTVTGGTLGVPGRIVPGADGVRRSAMQFDGNSVVESRQVLGNTTSSFSVAAWVKLTDGTVGRHVVSQGGDNPAFALEYSKGTGVWRLTAPSADGTQFPGASATSVPRLNTWTHLAGTYDASAHEMRLYVNGALENIATGVTVRSQAGPLRIGHVWAGAISEVQIWNRALAASDVFDLCDPILVGNVGEWHMDEVGPGPAFDASGMAHDLTFFNGAMIPASGAGQTGTGLRLDGIDDYAAPDAQVLHTDQSFTVSVWARPTAITTTQTFVSQQSTGTLAGFSLHFGPESGGLWKFRMHGSPSSDTNGTEATAPAVNVTASFHHLVGVFDAQKLETRLYVDGTLKTTTPMNTLWQAWDATGKLLIGRRQNGAAGVDFTKGDVDEVHVYQGVVTDIGRIP